MSGPVAVLPRYIALKGDNGLYLALKPSGLLTFDAVEINRLSTHEVLYNYDDANATFIIRSQNQHFWRRDSSGWIRADRDPSDIPSGSDTGARFKLGDINTSTGKLAFQSAAADGLYLKRLYSGLNGYSAWIASPDEYSYVAVSDAWEYAVTLPRYLFMVGDNAKYLHTAYIKKQEWLKFHGNQNGNLYGMTEVIPLLDGNLAMYSLQVQRCWRNSTNWIHPDVARDEALSNTRCQFEPVKLSSTILALRSVYNDRFCKRLSDYWESSLNAAASATSDKTSHLTISDATLSRYVFDVKYLLNLASTSDQKPLAVAYGSVINNSSYVTDMTVTATQSTQVSNSYTFSNSFTFSQSVSTEFKTGIPFLAEGKIEIEIGFEQSFSNEWNSTTSEGLEFGAAYLVKDVPPGAQAAVTVVCSSAKMRIPFTYKSKDTAPDGTDRPSQEYVDGIFEGVQAYKTQAIIDNGTTSYVANVTSIKKFKL